MRKLIYSMIALMFGTTSAAEPANWIVTKHEYEGLPLFTRYPNSLDFDKLQDKFPLRIVVTIAFSEVTERGLPVAGYNESLEFFDNFVREYFEDRALGQCVLIETFGGKRHFYIYVSDSADTKAFENAVRKNFSQYIVTFDITRDPKWSFIRRYAKEYLGLR